MINEDRMRKNILLTTLGIMIWMSAVCGVSAEGTQSSNNSLYSKKFISNLVKCKKYKEERQMEFFGMPVTPTVVVEGWQNGKCVYSNFPKESPESKYTCYFTKAQLKEILETSRKDQSKKETYKGQGMTYTSDPMSVLFTKYLNDGVTCKMPEDK